MTTNPVYSQYGKLFAYIAKTERCVELKPKEFNKLGCKFLSGKVWEVKTEVDVRSKIVDLSIYINLPFDFPFVLPRLFIESEFYESHKCIPHINHELNICVYDVGMNPMINSGREGEVLEYYIHKAKKIVQKGINDPDYSKEEFNREFKAYWEGIYSKKDLYGANGLHALTQKIEFPCIIKGLKFNKNFQFYDYFISDEKKSIEAFKSFLDNSKIGYKEIDIFFVKNPFDNPPFELSYYEALNIMREEKELYPVFKKWVNKSNWNEILIMFSTLYDSNTSYYGWTYDFPKVREKGFRKKTKIQLMDSPSWGRKEKVFRISFDNFTQGRLQKRTTGYIETQKSLAITGLGSVGSNLIFFLKNLPVNKFHLIDNELLSVDNIKRHLLGFSDVKHSKALAIEEHLIKDFPLLKTGVRNKSITEVILKESNFINECDFHIVALGNSKLEEFILEHLVNGNLIKPTIFFWVEPFLASGQMVYVTPEDASKAIDLLKNYPYHAIASPKDQRDKTYLVEGGCQSGYFPYSAGYLIQFLSATFPDLKKMILDGRSNSKVLSWIGNKKLIEEKKITISAFAHQYNTYDLISNLL